MRTKLMLAGIVLLLATAVQAQFVGTVRLVNGEKISGYLLAERGKLLVLTSQDTLAFSREEISRVWRGAPAREIKFGVSLFAGETSAIPSLPIGGMAGFNLRVSKIINLGAFFHYGENEKTRQWDKPEKVFSRSFGINYELASKELILIAGKANNIYSSDRRKSQGNLLGVMKYSGKFFVQVGYLSRPAGIIGGLGVKI